MPKGYEVRPKIWNETTILDLYDDDEYSAIWGIVEECNKRSLGVRWNGDNGDVGFPNQGKNPTWHIEPTFLEHAILTGLLLKVKLTESSPKQNKYKRNILIALAECAT